MAFSCEIPTEKSCRLVPRPKSQLTIGEPVLISGIGVFTGDQVSLRLVPADPNHGIVFQRVDLPKQPKLKASLSLVQETPRCTILGANGVCVQTVEHLLAALRAYQINNVLIEINAQEVPILDGSALPFVNMIQEAGVIEQVDLVGEFRLSSPLFWSQGDIHLVALPSDEYRISYTLHYPHSSFLRSQFYSVVVNSENFKNEIAPCRTFSLYEEIAPLVEKGFIKGGGLESAIIIRDDVVLNPEGLRFFDEMVRHKILDLIGDLSLVSVPFLAHIIAVRSGHASNNAFANELQNHIMMEIS